MSKFRPKLILFRVLLGESWREKERLDYLCAEFERSPLGLYNGRIIDDDDDRSSIISASTTSTVDDAPGTGRTIDTHIYQPLGRCIERLAMRFTIATLHPAHIAHYIEADSTGLYPLFDESRTMHEAVALLCSWQRNGSTIVAGMKGLVKQTQSNSIHKSACALAALIRVSLTVDRREIYANISRIEPVFHLETLAGSLHCSHPDKKWYLLLVKLAKETLIAVREPLIRKYFDPVLGEEVLQLWPSLETAQNLRHRLIRVLKVHRAYGLVSFDSTIGEACAICAEAVSTCIDKFARGDAYMHASETVYFTVIFILQSIHELANFARIAANRNLYNMVLRTVACWIDTIVYQCVEKLGPDHRRFDVHLLKISIAFRSLILIDGDTKYMLSPASLEEIKLTPLHNGILPRRHRKAAEWRKDIPPIRNIVEAAKERTQRLLRSFDALEREIWGCTTLTSISSSDLKIPADPYWRWLGDFGEEWWTCWKVTLGRARRVRVRENDLTTEFREARRIGLERNPSGGPKDWRWDVDWRWDLEHDEKSWSYYQLRRASRHKWGQYLRSNMDWDWDLETCMKRLFKIEKQTREGPSPAIRSASVSSPTIDMGVVPGETWSILAEEVHGILPKEVKIAYKTETGETQYISFTPASPSAVNRPVSGRSSAGCSSEEISGLEAVQQDFGYKKGTYDGEQETEDAGSSSSDDEKFVDCESILFEESVVTSRDSSYRTLLDSTGVEREETLISDVISI